MKHTSLATMVALSTFSTSLALQTDTDGFSTGGDNTIAVGLGSRSIAAGWGNEVWWGSIAAGEGNHITGTGSAAFGIYNYIDINSGYCLLSGESNQANNSTSNSILFGLGNELVGQSASGAFGTSNTIKNSHNGYSNFAIGQYNVVEGLTSGSSIQGSILLGVSNSATSSEAWAIGKGNRAQSNTITLGTYNLQVSNASLIVGNGASDTSRSNGLVVMRDGSVHIPSGTLLLGSSPSVTQSSLESHLNTNAYLKAATGGTISFGGFLSLGTSSHASGNKAIAIGGESAFASGSHSLAIGSYTFAGGPDSVAIGQSSFSNSYESIALSGGRATGDYSFASNYGEANGSLSIAMTVGVADGDGSIALGGMETTTWDTLNPNRAIGTSSTAIGGLRNQALGYASLATGVDSFANSAFSTVLGSGNKTASYNKTEWIETDPILVVGNARSSNILSPINDSERSNAITTLKNGQTTLTNKAWLAYVNDEGDPLIDPPATTTDSAGNALVVEGHTILKGKVIIEKPQGDISMGFYE